MKEGLTQEEAINRIFLFDSHGLVTKDREGLTPLKQKFAHELEPQSTFLDAIGEVKPTAIVGCAAQAGSFNAMYQRNGKNQRAPHHLCVIESDISFRMHS